MMEIVKFSVFALKRRKGMEFLGRQDNVKDMTIGSPVKLLLEFSVPLMIGNVFQEMYTFFDTMIVGRQLGITGLAAMGVAECISFMMFNFVQGITQGFAVVVSQNFGQGDKKRFRESVCNAYFLAIICAILFTSAGIPLLKPMLQILQTPVEIFDMAHAYLYVLFLGIPVTIGYNILAAILRAVGNSKKPLVAVIISSVSNIIMDIIFVVILRVGIVGAAFSTVIAQMLSMIYCLYVMKANGVLRLDKENRKMNAGIMKFQIFMGFPMGLQSFLMTVGNIAVHIAVNCLGIAVIAGYAGYTKIILILETAGLSYGYAISTFTAQNKGAGKKERVKAGFMAAMKIGTITAFAMALIMIFGGKYILRLLISETGENGLNAVEMGFQCLFVTALFFPLLYYLFIIRSSIQGMGDSLFPMIASFIQSVVRIVCAFVLTKAVGYDGVVWSSVLAWIGSDIYLMIVFFYRYRKWI